MFYLNAKSTSMNNNKTRATKNVNVIEMVHILYWVGRFNQTIFHPDTMHCDRYYLCTTLTYTHRLHRLGK